MFHPGWKPGADLLVITTKKGDLATPADFAGPTAHMKMLSSCAEVVARDAH